MRRTSFHAALRGARLPVTRRSEIVGDMNNNSNGGAARLWRSAGALMVVAAALVGCKGSKTVRVSRGGEASLKSSVNAAITMDGRFEDWPAKAAMTADTDWIYFKVSVEGLNAPLQAAPDTLALWLDADSNGKTGAKMTSPEAATALGVDEIVEFSPPGDGPGQPTKRGVNVYAADAAGHTSVVPSAQAEVLTSPSFASDNYEIRVSRHIDAATAPQLAKLLASPGKARGMFALIGHDGKLGGWSDVESFTLPAASPHLPMADAAVPKKEAGTVRVLSWNVLKSEITKNPQPFARVIQVMDPDIILLQEWETDAASAQAWFMGTVTGSHAWNAWASKEGGVAIISQHPIAGIAGGNGTPVVTADGGDGKQINVRFVAAEVKTPAGTVLAGTTHLKCCGTAGSIEDKRRINEAVAINTAMKKAFSQTKATVRVIGGDFNLVGTRTPLDAMRNGLDTDGSELAVAQTGVLGDAAIYTWSDHKTEFPDGRLDYLIYSDDSAEVANAFVLDTRRLSDRTLAKLGFDRTDTAASDHLPVIVDLKPGK